MGTTVITIFVVFGAGAYVMYRAFKNAPEMTDDGHFVREVDQIKWTKKKKWPWQD